MKQMDVLHSLRASTDLIRLEVKDAPTGTEEEEEEEVTVCFHRRQVQLPSSLSFVQHHVPF